MNIENDNWEPASRLYENMSHFNENICEIKQDLNRLPDFTDNLYQEKVNLMEIKEKKISLERIKAKLESTISLLNVLEESYHDYQEMYFENLK